LAGTDTLVTDAPPELAANFAPEDVDDRLTMVAEPLVVEFPNVSSSVVVNALVAELLAIALNADDVITSLLAAAAVMLKALLVAVPCDGFEVAVRV
jgi:hypothetical protein